MLSAKGRCKQRAIGSGRKDKSFLTRVMREGFLEEAAFVPVLDSGNHSYGQGWDYGQTRV